MSSTTGKGKVEILAGFPKPLTPMTGEHILREITHMLMDIIACAQSLLADTTPLNYLFIVVNQQQYARITQEPYHAVPADLGKVRPYSS